MRRRVKWTLVVVLGMTAALLAWQAASRQSGRVESGRWYKVQSRSGPDWLSLKGTLQPGTAVSVVAPFDGRLAARWVEYGEVVKPGQKLVRIESPEFEQQLREAEIALLRARQELHTAQHLDQTAEFTAAGRRLASARSAAGASHRRLAETKELYEQGIVARMELDSSQHEAQTSDDQVHAVQDELKALRERQSSASVRVLELEMQNRQDKLRELQARHAAAELVAPIGGVLMPPAANDGGDSAGSSRDFRAGASVSTRDTLFTIGDTQQYLVKAPVDEADVGSLQAGQQANVSLKSDPQQTHKGTIKRVTVQQKSAGMPLASNASASFEVQVTVQLPEMNGRPMIGSAADLRIERREKGPTLAVPLQALYWDDQGMPIVTVRDASTGKGVERKIAVKRTSVGEAVIESGLQDGEEVWIRPDVAERR